MNTLKIDNLKKIKDNTLLLDNINIEIKPGNIYGIISDNNDCLIELINIISGIEREDRGLIYFDSKKVNPNDRKKSVAIARGNINLIDNLNALDNIFISSLKNYSVIGSIKYKIIKKKANDILNKLETPINLKSRIYELNKNEKLIIEIAKVLAKGSDYLFFFNVTKSLTLKQYEGFTNILNELKKEGKIIILFPETAEDIKILIDKLFLINKGELVEIKNCKVLSNEKLNELLLSPDNLQLSQVFDPIYKAKVIIKNRIGDPEINFQKIAEEVYMGYENFRRKFKKSTGLSPNQYFIKLKIGKAKELLLYTHLEIKEIAYQLGFMDSCYFSRIFKEKENTSPTDFRKNRINYYKK